MSKFRFKEPCWNLIDVAVNLTDEMFEGKYNGKEYHKSDLPDVVRRAISVGVNGLLVTAGTLQDSKRAIELCIELNKSPEFKNRIHCLSTVGCHPTRCNEFLNNPDQYMSELDNLIRLNSVHNGGCVAAVGEIGLDYDRVQFCPPEVQQMYFKRQLLLSEKHRLPVYLHSRNTEGKLYEIITERKEYIACGGVVHSFTDSYDEAVRLITLGLYIGLNGCSFKFEENLNVIKRIPVEHIMIETDAPYCEMRNSHASRHLLSEKAVESSDTSESIIELLNNFPTRTRRNFEAGSMVKNRNEPCHLLNVFQALYKLHERENYSLQTFARKLTENTQKVFPFFLPSKSESEQLHEIPLSKSA